MGHPSVKPWRPLQLWPCSAGPPRAGGQRSATSPWPYIWHRSYPVVGRGGPASQSHEPGGRDGGKDQEIQLIKQVYHIYVEHFYVFSISFVYFLMSSPAYEMCCTNKSDLAPLKGCLNTTPVTTPVTRCTRGRILPLDLFGRCRGASRRGSGANTEEM